METVQEVGTRLSELHQAVWQLAAIALALREPDGGAVHRAAEQVLIESGLGRAHKSGMQIEQGLMDLIDQGGGDPSRLSSQAAAPLLQATAMLSGAKHWTGQDDDALLAQGRASAQGAEMFKVFAVPMMAGLGELLAGPSPAMLDIGVGVAAMAIAFCRAFPQMRLVGLDVFSRALQLATSAVEEAGLADRIELRHQDVAELDDRDTYSFAWLPAPFIPSTAIEAGVRRVASALVPGGWIAVGHGRFDEGPLPGAITRLQTAAFGGTALDNRQAEGLLSDSGFELVASLPTPPGSPAITVGRRPPRP